MTQYDDLDIRCPMLGHPLYFKYCRSTHENKPCRKIYDCWFNRIDIETFMNENFDEATIEAIKSPPKPKVLSLVELIEQAKKRNAESSDAPDKDKV